MSIKQKLNKMLDYKISDYSINDIIKSIYTNFNKAASYAQKIFTASSNDLTSKSENLLDESSSADIMQKDKKAVELENSNQNTNVPTSLNNIDFNNNTQDIQIAIPLEDNNSNIEHIEDIVAKNIKNSLIRNWNEKRVTVDKMPIVDDNVKVYKLDNIEGVRNSGVYKIEKNSKSYIVKIPLKNDFESEDELLTNLETFVSENNKKEGFPHIVKYKSSIVEKDLKFQLMEHAQGKSFEEIIKSSIANPEKLINILKTSGLQLGNFWQDNGKIQFLGHQWGFNGNIHGDLNFGNLFFSELDQKLYMIDYGTFVNNGSVSGEICNALSGLSSVLQECYSRKLIDRLTVNEALNTFRTSIMSAFNDEQAKEIISILVDQDLKLYMKSYYLDLKYDLDPTSVSYSEDKCALSKEYNEYMNKNISEKIKNITAYKVSEEFSKFLLNDILNDFTNSKYSNGEVLDIINKLFDNYETSSVTRMFTYSDNQNNCAINELFQSKYSSIAATVLQSAIGHGIKLSNLISSSTNENILHLLAKNALTNDDTLHFDGISNLVLNYMRCQENNEVKNLFLAKDEYGNNPLLTALLCDNNIVNKFYEILEAHDNLVGEISSQENNSGLTFLKLSDSIKNDSLQEVLINEVETLEDIISSHANENPIIDEMYTIEDLEHLNDQDDSDLVGA